MDDFSLGAFLGAFCGALVATPFWVRSIIVKIKNLQSCAHEHSDCPTIQPIEVGEEK